MSLISGALAAPHRRACEGSDVRCGGKRQRGGEPAAPFVIEVMELVDPACKLWPLFNELLMLRDISRERHLQTFVRPAFANLGSVSGESVAGLPKVIDGGGVTLGGAAPRKAQHTIAAKHGHLLSG